MSCSGCIVNSVFDQGDDTGSSANYCCSKQSSYDWLKELPKSSGDTDLVEVAFKNSRKDFYFNKSKINITRDDLVVVQETKGYDIGKVSLTGNLAELKLAKTPNYSDANLKLIYRKPNTREIDLWRLSKQKEKEIRSEAITYAKQLEIDFKISDVEVRGDDKKITFYYIADGRVDFRELLKVYRKRFDRVIEMRQISQRDEAAKIGGVGSCGRELCCSTWRKNLTPVPASAARYQNLPMVSYRLLGQCGKIKCSIMYELESYLEANEEMPKELFDLETINGLLYQHKVDLLERIMWFSFQEENPTDLIPLSFDAVKKIINLNKRDVRVDIEKYKS